jgi:hypothetical protein
MFMLHVSAAQDHLQATINRLFDITILFTSFPLIGAWIAQVDIASGYRLDDRGFGVRVPEGSRIFCSLRRPDWLWVPPNFLSNGYRELFPRG